MTTQEQNKKNNKKGLVLILSILLIGSVAFNIYSFVNNKAEAEKAQNDYIELSNDHEAVNELLADAEEFHSFQYASANWELDMIELLLKERKQVA